LVGTKQRSYVMRRYIPSHPRCASIPLPPKPRLQPNALPPPSYRRDDRTAMERQLKQASPKLGPGSPRRQVRLQVQQKTSDLALNLSKPPHGFCLIRRVSDQLGPTSGGRRKSIARRLQTQRPEVVMKFVQEAGGTACRACGDPREQGDAGDDQNIEIT